MIRIQTRRLSKLERWVLVLIAGAAVLSSWALRAGAEPDNLARVYFLNVGQGDSELIEVNGYQVLIDGGPDNKVVQELGKVMPFNDRSIDLVVLTHPHADHVNGLIEVLKRYHVNRIIENNVPYNTSEYAEWNKDKLQAQVTQARAGQMVDLGNGARLKILYPYQSGPAMPNGLIRNVHDYMVVSRFDYGQEGVLFTGDAEANIEDQLISDGASLSARFLKVGHHGSKTSSTEEFLDAVQPEAAFMEVGAKNRYGHPHSTTIQKLEDRAIKYYRTDQDGTVELDLDGVNYKIIKH